MARNTHLHPSVDIHPTSRESNVLVSGVAQIEEVELSVRDRPPLDAELTHSHLALWVFVVPAECMVALIQGRLVDAFVIVLSHRDRRGTECDARSLRHRSDIPSFRKGVPLGAHEACRRDGASAGALQQHIQQRLQA